MPLVKGISLMLGAIEKKYVMEGLAQIVGACVQAIGKLGSRLQSGQVQTYGAVAFIGLAVLLVILLVGGICNGNSIVYIHFSPRFLGILVLALLPKGREKTARLLGIVTTLIPLACALILYGSYLAGKDFCLIYRKNNLDSVW
ncbi:hypothetical protein GCM10020331_023680 [Ectobacillus funiculus]